MAKRTQRKDVGAWLGGNRGTVQSRMPRSNASDTEAKADAGGGQMEQVRAELGLGAYAAGVGAAGAIGAGVAAVRSGRVVNPVAAARNAARGERVVVSGTPNKIRGRSLNPRISEDIPDTAVVYSWNPRGAYAEQSLPGKAAAFSRGAGQGFPNPHNAQRNVVVGRVSKSSTVPHFGGMEDEALISTTPIRISGVVKAPVSNASDAAQRKYAKDLAKAIRRAGSSLRGQPLVDRLDNAAVNRLRMAASRQKLKIDKRIKKR